MVRFLALIGLATIVCAIFAAIFLNGSGARCLPPSALGVTVTPSEKALVFGRFRGTASDLKIVDKLIVAGATVSPVPTRVRTIERHDIVDDCSTEETLLYVEIGATILITLVVGVWIIRQA
jgi:hypothetical protein